MKWDEKSEEESIKIGESIWAQDMQKIRKSDILEEAANNAILKSKPTLKQINSIAEMARDDSSEEAYDDFFRKKEDAIDEIEESSLKSSISGSLLGTEEVKQEVNELLVTEGNIHHSQQYEEETKEYN